jgi:hypothetical protein
VSIQSFYQQGENSSLFFLVLFLGSAVLNIILLIVLIYVVSKGSPQNRVVRIEKGESIPLPEPPKRVVDTRHEVMKTYVMSNKGRIGAEEMKSILQNKNYPSEWIAQIIKEAYPIVKAVTPANPLDLPLPLPEQSQKDPIEDLRLSLENQRGDKVFDHEIFKSRQDNFLR